MDNSESPSETKKAILDASAALFELRDALLEVSMAIKDWQFENDLTQRQNSAIEARSLLQKLTTGL